MNSGARKEVPIAAKTAEKLEARKGGMRDERLGKKNAVNSDANCGYLMRRSKELRHLSIRHWRSMWSKRVEPVFR